MGTCGRHLIGPQQVRQVRAPFFERPIEDVNAGPADPASAGADSEDTCAILLICLQIPQNPQTP